MDKNNKYNKVLNTLQMILPNKSKLSLQAKMSITSWVLHRAFNHWLFCGFYVSIKSDILEIGPYQGQIIPCTNIRLGKGVCGTTAKEKKPSLLMMSINIILEDKYI